MDKSDHVNLHIHDEFSFLDGAMKNSDLVQRVAKFGQKALAVTNHGNVDGILRHEKACKAAGIQSLIGCELYMIDPEKVEKREKERLERYHLTAIVKGMDGLRKLMKGLTYANELQTGFNNRPILPLDYPLHAKWAGDVVLLTGCASSPFWKKEGGAWLPKYYEAFGEDLYSEIMPIHDFEQQEAINSAALSAGRKYGMKPVSTNDAHFLKADCCETHEVLLAIGFRQKWNDPKRWKFDSQLNYLRTPNEMLASFIQMGLPKDVSKASILNTREIAEKCSFTIGKIPVQLPSVLPEGTSEPDWMIDECMNELKRLGKDGDEVYQARLRKELTAIIEGGFTRYLLMVSELINWARSTGIMVGPGRGSVSGSLVCWLLGITQCDPIKYNLIFERFISEGRIDLPDIDIDFEDRKRWMIDEHLAEKYGANNVAKISTFAVLRGKQAIKDVSRVFEIPPIDAQEMANAIIVRPAADSRSSYGILDTVEMFEAGKKFNAKYPHVIKHAAALEGQVKNVGIHAAGRIISDKDLRSGWNCVLVKRRTGRRVETVVNWDKKDAEPMGLMKLDVLGLATLSVLDECQRLIKDRHGKKVVWTEIDLEDRKVYEECISKGLTATCFQIGSRGLQKLSIMLKTDNFKTLVDSSALWRPGCLKSGITDKYILCHNGKEKPKYLNSIHKEICKDTHGQVLYQEQIMYFMFRLAGIPWKTADSVRKIISKREGGAEWEKYKKVFKDGCVKLKTMDADQAEALWEKLRFFGMYAFNLSHATTYSMISFWTAWAKVYYPAEYMAAYLNCAAVQGKEGASQMTKLDEALRECQRMGLKISRPDINRSGARWTIYGERELVAGLSEVKGVSPETADLLMDAREKAGGSFKGLPDLVQNVDRRRANKGVIHKLLISGAFDAIDLKEAKAWMLDFERLYPYVLTESKLSGLIKEKLEKVEEEWALHEAEFADLRSLSLRYKTEAGGGSFGRFRKFIKQYLDITDIATVERTKTDREVFLCGTASSIKYSYKENIKLVQETGKEKGTGGVYGIFDDGTGFMYAVYSSKLYQERKATIEKLAGKSILVKGRYSKGRSNFSIDKLWTMEELSQAKFRGLGLSVMEAAEPEGWKDLRNGIVACKQCNLHETCKRPTPFSQGSLRAAIVGEAPGREEERVGIGFQGAAGMELWKTLRRHGLSWTNFMLANVVACRPPNNKLPHINYVNKCTWLTTAIQRHKPLSILAVGNSAMYYFNGQPKGIRELNGTTEWVPKVGAWVTYCIHPASVLYEPKNRPEFERGIGEFVRVLSMLS